MMLKTHTEDTMKKTIGQIGYDTYGGTASWKTFDGRPMPTWEQLGATEAGRETQRRWEIAAVAVGIVAIDGAIGERQAALKKLPTTALWLWWTFLTTANVFLLGLNVGSPKNSPITIGATRVVLVLVIITAALQWWNAKRRKPS